MHVGTQRLVSAELQRALVEADQLGGGRGVHPQAGGGFGDGFDLRARRCPQSRFALVGIG